MSDKHQDTYFLNIQEKGGTSYGRPNNYE